MINFIKQKIKISRAKSAGKIDGKSGIPFPDWKENSVPYLQEIYGEFKTKLSDLENRILLKKQKINENDYSKKVTIESLEIALVKAKDFEDQAKKEFDSVKEIFDGGRAESPKSKFARTRSVGLFIYLVLLVAMIIGEFAITYPAFETFLGDKTIPIAGYGLRTAVLTAIGATALTIAFAHMTGVYLKLMVDREKPTPGWTTWALSIIGFFVLITILFLSVLRGAGADTSRLKDAIDSADNRRLFVIFMFFCLQLSLVLVATGLGFLRHSHHVDELDKLKKHWNQSRKARMKIEKNITNAKKQNKVDLTQVEKDLLDQYKVQAKKLDSQYLKVASSYVTANLRFRQDKVDGSVDPFQIKSIM